VIDIALHIQYRHARSLGDFVQVSVAYPPITVADRDAVKVAPVNLANLLWRITVRNLRRAGLNECRVSAKMGHAGFERAARARTAEEEQHSEHFIPQIRGQFVQRAFPL